MSEMDLFKEKCNAEIIHQGGNDELLSLTNEWLVESAISNYSYHFEWFGRPIIQYPQDIVAMQEIIWRVKPDLIIETGIARGGSLIFSASMLAQIDMCEAIEQGTVFDPTKSQRKVLGIDIDIRSHNRTAIDSHPMRSWIEMIEGSSIDQSIVDRVCAFAKPFKKILVCLDSNHTHEHVLAELNAYASLVSVDSYCVVFDTIIEDMPDDMFPDRPWSKGNNPKTASAEFLKTHPEFEINRNIQNKLLITVAPDGFLRRIK